jgi:hypothetical protein
MNDDILIKRAKQYVETLNRKNLYVFDLVHFCRQELKRVEECSCDHRVDCYCGLTITKEELSSD